MPGLNDSSGRSMRPSCGRASAWSYGRHSRILCHSRTLCHSHTQRHSRTGVGRPQGTLGIEGSQILHVIRKGTLSAGRGALIKVRHPFNHVDMRRHLVDTL